MEVREILRRFGGAPDRDLRGAQESWRIRLGSAVFTAYATGTIYCSGGREPELEFLYHQIDERARS